MPTCSALSGRNCRARLQHNAAQRRERKADEQRQREQRETTSLATWRRTRQQQQQQLPLPAGHCADAAPETQPEEPHAYAAEEDGLVPEAEAPCCALEAGVPIKAVPPLPDAEPELMDADVDVRDARVLPEQHSAETLGQDIALLTLQTNAATATPDVLLGGAGGPCSAAEAGAARPGGRSRLLADCAAARRRAGGKAPEQLRCRGVVQGHGQSRRGCGERRAASAVRRRVTAACWRYHVGQRGCARAVARADVQFLVGLLSPPGWGVEAATKVSCLLQCSINCLVGKCHRD